MNLNELRISQAEFEKSYSDIEFEEINKKREKFLKDFSYESINTLDIDKYVLGLKKDSTFCYWIETKLNDWGNIHGSPASKFGVYYGKYGKDEIKKFRYTKKFGNSKEEAYKNVLSCIRDLLDNKENLEALKKNILSPMYKGKILSIYFPEDFLNIFSLEYLKYFIRELSLTITSDNELDLQEVLLQYKNHDEVMKNWNIYKYSKFLYYTFGSPKSKKIDKKLKQYQLPDFPNITDINIEYIDIDNIKSNTNEKKLETSNKKFDYEKINKYRKRIGDIGEHIVFQIEEKKLKELKINKTPEFTSKVNDNAGYDIQSYDDDSNKLFIEVKTTNKKFGETSSYITCNELEQSEKIKNYYFYFIFEVLTKKPKILKIKSSDFHNMKIDLIPVSYKFNINVK